MNIISLHTHILEASAAPAQDPPTSYTVIPKDYWDEKNFQDMGPSSVNSIHISVLLFEKNKIF